MTKHLFSKTLVAVFLLFCGMSVFSQSKHWAPPKPGAWTVTASDEEGMKWSGQMHIAGKAKHGAKYRGYFRWISGDETISGNEYFRGTFDRSTGRLKLHGYRVRNVQGKLGLGNYTVWLRRGRELKGGWAGGNSVPGKLTAVWDDGK